MVVHNLGEYVRSHQEKLRKQNAPSSTSSFTSPQKRRGVNQLRSQGSFKTSVIDKTDETLVVIDAFATWCGPCKAISPVLVKLSDQFTNVQFYKIDVDEVPEVAQELGIRAMPTFKFFKGGKEVAELVGADPNKLKSTIEQYA